MFGEITGGDKSVAEFIVEKDGHTLSPLVKYYKLSNEQVPMLKQKIIF